MPPSHITQWLQTALATYVYKDQAFQAAGAALDAYPSLKVKTDQYTFDDGRTLLLLCIHGTLPITYASARYNVPVNIWFPLDYPKSPPLVYVVPTSGMMVRKGRGVALDGKVEEDDGSYLGGWRRKPEAHAVLPLLQSLVDSFSIQPPVFAKPKTSSTQPPPPANGPPPSVSRHASTSSPVHHNTVPTSQHHSGAESLPTYSRPPQPPPPPPPPSGSPSPHPSVSQTHDRQTSYSSGPPAPPLPPFARGSSLPSQSPPRSAPQSPSAIHLLPSWGGDPPPPNLSWSAMAPGQQQQPGQWGPPPPSSFQQQPFRPPPPPTSLQSPSTLHQQPQSQFHPQQQQQRPHPLPNGSYRSPPTSYSQPQQPPYDSQHTQPHPFRPPLQQSTPAPAPAPRQPIPDLMSSIDLPLSQPQPPPPPGSQQHAQPPPPPPNPELLLLHSTLQTRLSSTLASHLTSLSTRQHQLLQIREDLASAPAAIEDEMGRLKAVRDVCLGVGERVGKVVREGEERVGKVGGNGEGGREEVSVDEVVCSTTIVYNQLIDLVAEDAAISDTLYQLNRALHNEKIDLERFLKATRILAREQFMKRALVERIVKG